MQDTRDQDMYDINSAWDNYICGHCNFDSSKKQEPLATNDIVVPKGTDIYISTKTKICYLSEKIDLFTVFWKIDILPYHIQRQGVVKKQMKFNFADKTALDATLAMIGDQKNVDQYIIQQIVNPAGRIKFKDIRKISIGLSSKDISSYRTKKKSAFYNCFVIIMRLNVDGAFKEVHVKVFNTGKLEIPGIRCNKLLVKVMDLLVEILKPLTESETLTYDINHCETVLINSNFNCGFYINRDKLLDILKYKYKIDCIFDSCQYPGIQCKYNYADEAVTESKYRISFMIFRTGSVLIVGKCDENTLIYIYEFIKNLLITEYMEINVKNTEPVKDANKKKKKVKKRSIFYGETPLAPLTTFYGETPLAPLTTFYGETPLAPLTTFGGDSAIAPIYVM